MFGSLTLVIPSWQNRASFVSCPQEEIPSSQGSTVLPLLQARQRQMELPWQRLKNYCLSTAIVSKKILQNLPVLIARGEVWHSQVWERTLCKVNTLSQVWITNRSSVAAATGALETRSTRTQPSLSRHISAHIGASSGMPRGVERTSWPESCSAMSLQEREREREREQRGGTVFCRTEPKDGLPQSPPACHGVQKLKSRTELARVS